MAKVLLLLAKIAEVNSEFESALDYYKKHTQLKKELTKVEIENKHQYLKLNYKAKKTEQDISMERITNRKLKSALDKEKDLNDLKSRFVSVTSHQFRTPMAIIQSNTDLVNMIILNSESKQKVQLERANRRIQKEIHTMVSLMDDILILGKISSGKTMTLNQTPINAENFCQDIISGFNELQKDNRKVILQISGKMKMIMVDRNLLKHILRNLVSNAFKYSAERNPKIDLVFEKDNLVISVIDKGIGIPKHDLPNLFEPFHRATNVGEISGTGLGLSIAKEYVELLNGSLTVHSELNKGTTAVLSLPYK
jgi:signal transduction histidine kinase